MYQVNERIEDLFLGCRAGDKSPAVDTDISMADRTKTPVSQLVFLASCSSLIGWIEGLYGKAGKEPGLSRDLALGTPVAFRLPSPV